MARPELLTDAALANALTGLAEWEYDTKTRSIARRFRFKDYTSAFVFVTHASMLAERLNHHPDIRFGWGYANITLLTHDMGGITELDITLATQIDRITA